MTRPADRVKIVLRYHGSGRVRKSSNSHGSGQVTLLPDPTRADPRGLTRPVKGFHLLSLLPLVRVALLVLFRGTIVNGTKVLLVKMVYYSGFFVYHRSYYLWSPVIV